MITAIIPECYPSSFTLLLLVLLCVCSYCVLQGFAGPRGDKGDKGESGERGRDGPQVSWSLGGVLVLSYYVFTVNVLVWFFSGSSRRTRKTWSGWKTGKKKKKSYKKSQQNEFEFNISSLHFYLNVSYLYSAMTQDSQEISDSIYYTAGVNANSNTRL